MTNKVSCSFVIYECFLKNIVMLNIWLVLIFVPNLVLSQWKTCEPCYCMIYYDRFSANCDKIRGRYFKEIPKFLNPSLQDLDLTNQSLHTLPSFVFLKVKLVNLRYLTLNHCKLSKIHETAFSNLTNLIELRLAYNNITRLHNKTFTYTYNLQGLYLQGNKLQIVHSELLKNLTSLQWLELQENQIKTLDYRLFLSKSHLSSLKLHQNQFHYLNISILDHINFTTLTIYGNPWICDCHLTDLHNWFIKSDYGLNLEPTCLLPNDLKGEPWSELNSDEFRCWLDIEYPTSNLKITAYTDAVTLPCLINSSPDFSVKWQYKNETLNLTNSQNSLSIEKVSDGKYWYNLTIAHPTSEDIGVYECVARNNMGIKRIRVEVSNNRNLVFKHLVMTVAVCFVFVLSILAICVKCVIRFSIVRSMRREYYHDNRGYQDRNTPKN